MFLLSATISISFLLNINNVESSCHYRAIRKKISSGVVTSDVSGLANYYKSLGFLWLINPKSVLDVTSCTGYFVDTTSKEAAATDSIGFFVTAAHCFGSVLPDSVKTVSTRKSEYEGQKLYKINEGKATIYFGSTSKKQQKSITIDFSKHPLRIPFSYQFPETPVISTCPAKGDFSVIQLSVDHVKLISDSGGRFLQLSEIDNEIGVEGENCWIAGFGGKSVTANIANLTYYTADCYYADCNTADDKSWWACMRSAKGQIELGDSGGPIWCERNTKGGSKDWKISGILSARDPEGKVVITKASKMLELLPEAFSDENKHG